MLVSMGFVSSAIPVATAQHASDNLVLSADDAFGLTLGLESIGIYGPNNVRGFNPQAAGNTRIDGLYFDQQGVLSNRVLESSSIRVGISAIGFTFPAPTGIVNYELRHVSNGEPTATLVAGAGPFESRSLSLDGSLPLNSGLQVPIGAGSQITAIEPGYTSRVDSFGVAPQWSPDESIRARAFFDWNRTSDAKTMPFVFTQGSMLPSPVPNEYFGQNWAQGQSLSENYGGTVHAMLTSRWSVAAGVFRSISDSPASYADLYVNTSPGGTADHLLVGNPNQRVDSTSGEIKVTDHLSGTRWCQDVTLMVRGRATSALYGGSDTVDAGEAVIGQGAQMAKPAFTYTARTRDFTELYSEGAAYRLGWRDHDEVTVGVLKETYRDTVTPPGQAPTHLAESPRRAYGTFASAITERATLYAGYVQGLEDSGVAPSTAQDRNTILPAAQTWQVDAGLRYSLTPGIKVIVGAFNVEKPYFNFDLNNIDRELGSQRARGVELSVTGEVTENFHINAGSVIDEVKVSGPNLAAEGIGRFAVGQPRGFLEISGDYSVAVWPSLSFNMTVQRWGSAPTTVNDSVDVPAYTMLNLGGRYHFKVSHAPATLRVIAQGLTNAPVWYVGQSPGYYRYVGRTFLAYVSVDL